MTGEMGDTVNGVSDTADGEKRDDNGMDADDGGEVKCEVVDVLTGKDCKKKGDEPEDGPDIETKNVGKEGESEEQECVPPALPPRPPPRSRQMTACNCTCDYTENGFQQGFQRTPSRSCWASGLRKYVFLCTACGSLSILLGTLFLTVYIMLKSYTSSLNHFETIPTYVPSGMLIATGFLITCLACRKNRNSFLMKLCGLCSLCCAVLCVSVTVTTTVIHMNRLQTLRECLYTQKTQSCTCYSVLMDNDRTSDEGLKFVFNSTPDCEVIHGALYSCLRAIFGLSVIGILVCIFGCMLVYQLLSHEKKKMYWAQLEMRCRYLYRQQRNPHYCSCCDECRYPPPPHEIFPWELMGNRFWSSGRVGNLYTPNPEDRDGNNRLRSAWNWRRLPWNRSGSSGNDPSRANLGSPDSQYGFSSTPTVDGAPYTVLDPRTANCPPSVPPGTDITEGGFYSWGPPPPYASNRNSANNSPARRSLGEILHQVSPIRRNDNVSPIRPYHHVHHHHVHHPHAASHQCSSATRQVAASSLPPQSNCVQKLTPSRAVHGDEVLQQQQLQPRAGMENGLRSNSLTSMHRYQKTEQGKDNYENAYESEIFPSTNGFNTLPSLKKRNQGRASELFQNETTSAYYFSSAENLGCSEGSDGQFRSENLPPRVFLLSETSRGQRYEEAQNLQTSNRTMENGNFVKKLFVSCSPTKQKPETEKNPPKKKRSGTKEGDSGSENVITFHYRLGIPRSPNIQNFGALTGKEENETAEESQVPKGVKYMTKDAELLQKHGSLMKEFNKNIDLQKNLKHKSEKTSGRGNYGIENRGFQIMEEYRNGKYEEQDASGKNENESDVYFGDISNSSCYVSVQNEGGESSLYEEAVEQSHLRKQKRLEEEEHLENPTYTKLDQNYRTWRQYRLEETPKKEEVRAGPSQDGRSQRRPFPNLDNKYYPSGCFQYQETSNDEHSSSSLTVDSGISTGRSYLPRYDATYQEIEGKENQEGSACFETLNERFTNMEKFQQCKIPNLENISDFSHPMFQKPKTVPRATREQRQKKETNTEDEGKSPKPLPRNGKYPQKEKHFLAPDAQYEYKSDFKQKTTTKSGKPVVPARPINLQERCRNFAYCKTESGCPPSRRRHQQTTSLEGAKSKDSTGSHSVNV